MKKIHLEPLGDNLLSQTGASLLTSLIQHELNIKMSCGGRGYCSTCRVTVKQGMNQLSPVESRERKTLSLVSGATPDCRLACQSRVLGDGLIIEVPKGMYIEKAEDLLTLLGTRATDNILHPIDGRVLIPKDKIITRSLLEQTRTLQKEVERMRERAQGQYDSESSTIERNGGRFLATGTGLAPTKRFSDSFSSTSFASSRFSLPAPEFNSSIAVGSPPPSSFATITPREQRRNIIIEPGAVVDKFQLISEIGRGGSGVVYKALHLKLGTIVAMKFLNQTMSNDHKSIFERFRNEARILAALNHPNVVRVLDFEDTSTTPYVVMEYVDGESASTLIKQNKQLSLDVCTGILSQVAQGLQAALDTGIVHRDVKPGNILVAKDWSAKLVDLGLAVKLRRSDGRDNQALAVVEGTVGYMAPEQMTDGMTADHRADIYSLGVTFYHMISGRMPHTGVTRDEIMQKHRTVTPTPPHFYVTGLRTSVSDFIMKMMSKNPADRPQTYGDVIEQLKIFELKAAELSSSIIKPYA